MSLHNQATNTSIKMLDGQPLPRNPSVDDLAAAGSMFTGTPDQVYGQIKRFYDGIGGFGHLLMMGQAGALGHADTLDNLSLFANEVYPRLKELN
jgi:alkanesulfonate monooxygenase SsuD/methylene tetrahydromethanopterin reductase-like flavin-dependent oxidoreductase (luciferase family)